MGLVTLWNNWLPWSQGVVIAPLIAKFRSPWLRLFWFVTLLATTAAFVYQSVCMVQDYLAYQKTTNIQLFYEPEAPFPAVTFCNLNPFKRTMVHHSKELSNLVTAYNYVKKVKQAQHLSTHATVLPSNGTVTPGLNRKRRGAEHPAGTGQTAQPSGAGQTGNSSGTAMPTTTPLTTSTTTTPSTTITTTTTTTPTSTSTTTMLTTPVPSTTTATTTEDVTTWDAPVTAAATTTSYAPTTVATMTPTTSTGPITSTATVLTSTSESTSPTTASTSSGASSSSTTASTTTMMTSTVSKTTGLSTSTSASIAPSESSVTSTTAATTPVSTDAQPSTFSSSPLATEISTTSTTPVTTTSPSTTPASSTNTTATTNATTTSELPTTTAAAMMTASTTTGLTSSTTLASTTSETKTPTTASTTITETVLTTYASSTTSASTVTIPPSDAGYASANTDVPKTSTASFSSITPSPAVEVSTSAVSTTKADEASTTGSAYVSIAATATTAIVTSASNSATTLTSTATTARTSSPKVAPTSTIATTASGASTPVNNDTSATTAITTETPIPYVGSVILNASTSSGVPKTPINPPSAESPIASVKMEVTPVIGPEFPPTTQLDTYTKEQLPDPATTQLPFKYETATSLAWTTAGPTSSRSPLRSSSTNPALRTESPALEIETSTTLHEASASSQAQDTSSPSSVSIMTPSGLTSKTVFYQSPTTSTSIHGQEGTSIVGNTSKSRPSSSSLINGTSSTAAASATKSTTEQQVDAESTVISSSGLLTSTTRRTGESLSLSASSVSVGGVRTSKASKSTTSLASESGTSTTVAPDRHAVPSITTKGHKNGITTEKRSVYDGQLPVITAQTSTTTDVSTAAQGHDGVGHNATLAAATTIQSLENMLSSTPPPSMSANQLSTTKTGLGKNEESLTTVHPGHTTDNSQTLSTSNTATARQGDHRTTSDNTSAIPSVPITVSYFESSAKSMGTTATTTTALPPSTTSPKINLKNITLDLGPDFELAELTDEQRKNLDALSNAYGLNPNSDQVSIDARMKVALQVVAAKMPPEVRELVGFKLKDLVSSCIINGEPCDQNSDFTLTFDVDYGNCYTFNAGTPVKYITQRSGASYGLRMVIASNISEQLPSTAEEGVKIVVHGQETMPFPNVQGYKSSTGRLASHIVTYSKISRLGAPYGQCSTNESIESNGQPFYYNGSYSTEGCFRSCFQRNLAKTCGCVDARFPTPTDMNVPFCDPLEPLKYKCLEAYIKMKGDYYFVDNCDCYDPCEVTRYKSQIAEGIWPAGGFFYGPYCPMAKQLNFTDCAQFYSENGMTLEVSFAQLGYELLEEEPVCTMWCLINNLAGNTGFWVGYTMLTFSECILIAAQVLLWIFRCPKELPEVPSCRRRNFFADHEDGDGDSEDDESCAAGRYSGKRSPAPSSPVCDGSTVPPGGPLAALRRRASALPRHILPPKNFDNCFSTAPISPQEFRAQEPSRQERYSHESPYESVNPVAAHSTHYADHTHVE